jgi:hypothetical protein
MPLYGGPRDRALIRRINNELLQRIIGVEVAVYKLAVADMDSNIYGESSEKRYYNPMRVHALVRRDDSIVNLSETGEISKDKTLSIGFLRDELVNLNLVMEVSDIIEWDGGYYQVDNVRQSSGQWWGRNPDTSIPIAEGDSGDHGYSVSVIVEVHRTSTSNLNLVETRSGINSLTTKSKLPRNL